MTDHVLMLLHVTSEKVIMSHEISSSTPAFNSSLINNINDPYTNKAYKKNRLVIYAYNNEKKNFMLIYSLKILGVSQGIGSYLAIII